MPGTIEKATFDRDHLDYISKILRMRKRATEKQIEKLEKHIKNSERLEETLKKAIKGFDETQKQLNKIRKSQTWQRLMVMTKKGYDKILGEAEAIKTLEEAHAQRKEHLEYIRQVRGEAKDYVRNWKRTAKVRK